MRQAATDIMPKTANPHFMPVVSDDFSTDSNEGTSVSEKTNTYFGTSVVAMIVVIGIIALVLNVSDSVYSTGAGTSDMSTEATAERLKPVGQLNTGAPIVAAAIEAPASAAPAAAARSGETVYNTTCMACHAAGIAGAPKVGDQDAWGERIAKGLDTLVQHSINGFQGNTGVMPPRGTCGNCSDDELKAAVEYMVSQVN